MKERPAFTQNLSVENSANYYLCFRLVLLHSVPYFVFLYQSLSLSLCTVFDDILSNIDKVLLINKSADMAVFGDFKVHCKEWLTYSGGTDIHGELYYRFSISKDPTQTVNIATWSPVCNSLSPTVLDFFFFSDANVCSTMTLSIWEL